jgi:hypothetical protein
LASAEEQHRKEIAELKVLNWEYSHFHALLIHHENVTVEVDG